jgi:hypothetical protein
VPPQRAAEQNSLSAREPEPATSPDDEPVPAQSKQNHPGARLEELLARADQAAHRITAHRAEQQASREYSARLEREARSGPEAEQQAETRDGFEMEL